MPYKLEFRKDEEALQKALTNATILVVDDEPFNVDILQIELEDRGFKVICAGDGIEALELVENNDFDIALLDVMMPRMDGIELTSRLKSDPTFCKKPIILLTARDEMGDKAAGFAVNADDYVVKPFDIEDVLARIEVQLRISWFSKRHQAIGSNEARLAMIGAAAHELAQPLAGANGYYQLLTSAMEMGNPNPELLEKRKSRITDCLAKMRLLADKMAGLKRVELEDYACGLHIVNIHAEPVIAEDEAGHETILLVDSTGNGDNSLRNELTSKGFKVITKNELTKTSNFQLLLLQMPDSVTRLREIIEELEPALLANRPSIMSIIPAAISSDTQAGLGLMKNGVDDILIRPFQMEELYLRLRSRISLYKYRQQDYNMLRLQSAASIVNRALSRLLPVLDTCENLFSQIDLGASPAMNNQAELSSYMDSLTAIVRELQSRDERQYGEDLA
jgi:DNA-binding response OmpR family regulator